MNTSKENAILQIWANQYPALAEIVSKYSVLYSENIIIEPENLPDFINDFVKYVEAEHSHKIQTGELYYMQDTRANCGNNMMFWRKGCQGYTQCIADAEVFTADEAIRQMISRRSDIPWRKDYIDGIASLSVDTQRADIRAANMLPPSQRNDLPESLRDQA
ncbi:hypothetical protein SAMN05216326_12525 [Nitrosomonas marina]|uniref:Uncharacterized protein n=1 Tax=Nitrosomonas marina TaxID=917 RepID=A0A1I0E5V8_9PROT|nr:hypothetical protein [Nitrosomonas marina]SET40528.1 hypothetical protein SAMN05216326_12525 [Nitrosomonas marina]